MFLSYLKGSFNEPGFIWLFVLGVIVGYGVASYLLGPKKSAAGIVSVLAVLIGGTAIQGLTGYLLKEGLWARLDQYGLGLAIGSGACFCMKILAGVLRAIAAFLRTLFGLPKS